MCNESVQISNFTVRVIDLLFSHLDALPPEYELLVCYSYGVLYDGIFSGG